MPSTLHLSLSTLAIAIVCMIGYGSLAFADTSHPDASKNTSNTASLRENLTPSEVPTDVKLAPEKQKTTDGTILGLFKVSVGEGGSGGVFVMIFVVIAMGVVGMILYEPHLMGRLRQKELYGETPLGHTQTLRIIRTDNEYSLEYRDIYDRGIKVMTESRENLIHSVRTFVTSMNHLTVTRGTTVLDDLSKLDINIPDLADAGQTIYRLFLSERIREGLTHQDGNLIVRTDDQEIPWELMHNGKDFLGLVFPMAREILTTTTRRRNPRTTNRRPKILLIANPTGDLEGTIREVDAIRQGLGSSAEMIEVRCSDASATRIFSLLARDDWDIIHYAGHAYFNEETPNESGLILADRQIVSVGEIRRSLGGNPLICLNACSSGVHHSDTSISAEDDSDRLDTVGLAGAFVMGGAKGVVATLWPVNDHDASVFATTLYQGLLYGHSIGQSLLASKHSVQKLHADQDPRHNVSWAAFTYYGNPDDKLEFVG